MEIRGAEWKEVKERGVGVAVSGREGWAVK